MAFAGLMLAGMTSAWPAQAQPSFDARTKAALKVAIQEASSGTWLSAATIEQRIEAGLTFLRSEGYYGASIELADADQANARDERDGFIVAIPNDDQRLFVRLGPLFTIGAADLDLKGPESGRLEAARAQTTTLLAGLKSRPARSTEVLRVQSQALATLKEAGFTQAEDAYPDIVVDHATSTMNVTYKANAGPLTTFGDLTVSGSAQTPTQWVEATAAIRLGDVATGERLRKIAERFRLTGAYQNVELGLDPIVNTGPVSGVANVTLALQERDKRIWSAGGVWSTTDGLGLDASTSFFHRFNQADTLTFDGKVGTLESSVGTSLRLPSFRGPSRDLFLEARAGQETSDAFERLIARIGASYIQPRGRKDLLTYGIELNFTRTQTPQQGSVVMNSADVNGSDLSFLIRYERDRADDLINPTQGWRASGELQPSVFFSEDETIPYGRLVLSGAFYRPLSILHEGVFAARVKTGVLLTTNDELPFDRRFFAGGGGSVRGYAFQSIGPRDMNDNPIGGRFLLEGTLEARWSLRGPFGLAVFADAARVGALEDLDQQQTKVGVGIGLRYDLGFAPLRLDLAIPLNKGKGDAPVQLYLSAGQSF